MHILKVFRSVAASGVVTMGFAGMAFADSAQISDTGPDSHNEVSVHNSVDMIMHNDNDVTVTNTNDQYAQSGNASVTNNTSGGDARSGEASNSNTVSTAVEIENGGLGAGGGDTNGPGGGQGSGAGGGSGSGAGGAGGGAAAVGGMGGGLGQALGGLGGGVAMLPEVGCTAVCDVSALRAGYKTGDDSVAKAIQQSKGLSAGLLALAAILSLAGAGGSAMYATKRVKA